MSTYEAVIAARSRAQIGIADVLERHHGVDEDGARRAAENILARLERDGWHHQASHAAPPEPTGKPAPSDSAAARESLAAMRAELDQIQARHRAEDTGKEHQ